MNNKTVLVTGAAGFLGSHLCDSLLARGHRVIGVDNLSYGSLDNLVEASRNPRFEFHKADVTDERHIRQVAQGIDAVAHLAASKIPRYASAMQTLLINSQGSWNLLKIAAEQKAKFVITSTSDVYGRNPQVPFSETSESVLGPSTVPRWAYAVSKLFDEHLAFAFGEEYGIPVTILRIFGSYGPRQHLSWWGGPQSVFIDAILRDHVIPIHGDGNQTRSFTFVSDTVSGIVAALEHDTANNQIINVGSTHEICIVDLAKLIARLCGAPESLRLEFVPYKKISGRDYEDVMRRIPDVRKAKELFGFEAKVSLEEGLRRTIEWQRSRTAVALEVGAQ